ncbi:MAG: gamma-glutamyl-gamma-aminobutyrate hydrolase family protein [Deltaproteobacteria bacterium]
MRIHYFQHVPYEGLGNIEGWIKSQKYSLSATRFYAADPLPQLAEIDLLIIMGGPMGAYDDIKYPWLTAEKQFIQESINAGKKVLGICLGAQLIAMVLGAKVYPHIHKEIGWFPLKVTEEGMESKVFKDFPNEFLAFHWHEDTFSFPRGAARLAETVACRNQAFSYGDKVVGLQFHLDAKRENIERWIENGAAELGKEQYIQTPEQMLAPEDEFEKIQEYMYKILDYLETVD